MATDRKAVVLARIQKEMCCTKSRLMNFCGVDAKQAATICRELAQEGKIKIWTGIREGAFYASTPDHPGPGKEKARPTREERSAPATPSNGAPERSKQASGVNRKPRVRPQEPDRRPPPGDGADRGGPGDPAVEGILKKLETRLADLDRRREKLVGAIDALRALA